jgi:hypothetical protein
MTAIRATLVQNESAHPVFVGHDWTKPDWQCGNCSTILAQKVAIEPYEETRQRILPFPIGAKPLVLGEVIGESKDVIAYRGNVVIKCAGCGSLNETVAGDSNPAT